MDSSANVDRLRWCATGIVVLAFLAGGLSKIIFPDAGLTMLGRFLPMPNAVRALGCMEVAMALWLLSGRSLRLALCIAGIAIFALTLLIGWELQRNAPLPCGCMPAWPGTDDVFAPQRGLWVAFIRNAFLMALCVLGAILSAEGSSMGEIDAGIIRTKLSENLYRR